MDNLAQSESGAPRKKMQVWIFSVALFPLGLGGFTLGAFDIARGYQSLKWLAVPGKVLSSHLSPSFLAPSQPEIRYSYYLNGEGHVSNRIWPGKIFAFMPELSFAAVGRLLSEFPAEREVLVYVNPADVSQSVLVPGPKHAYFWMSVFAFFVLIGLWSPLALGRFMEGKNSL